MMEQPTKKQKVEETTSCKEVLFNSDTLSKVISYLPSVDLLNLAVTCTRYGVSNTKGDELSLIEESVRIAVQDLATDEQLAALPRYEGESSLADYHYLQLLRAPLAFDQLVGPAEYVGSGDKLCVRYTNDDWGNLATALSNNILRAGKHYVSFTFESTSNLRLNGYVGVMRPGQTTDQSCTIGNPLFSSTFFKNFSHHNKNYGAQCCMYDIFDGDCHTSEWGDYDEVERWEGSESLPTHGKESISSGDEIGMLLDLDEGTLSVHKNGRKLGVMKRGLAGPYCWVVSFLRMQVSIKRGAIPS